MARPTTRKLTKPMRSDEPGRIKPIGISTDDIIRDIRSNILPIFNLGISAAKSSVAPLLRAYFGLPAANPNATASDKAAASAMHEILERRGQDDPLGRRLWALISAALIQALANAIDDYKSFINVSKFDDLTTKYDVLEAIDTNVVFTESMLYEPHAWLLKAHFDKSLGIIFESFLIGSNLHVDFIEKIIFGYFDVEFWAIAAGNQRYFNPVLEHLNSPFLKSVRWKSAEQHHRARLAALPMQPVMGASFTLGDIFVAPRFAHWQRKTGDLAGPGVIHVSDAVATLLDWLSTPVNENSAQGDLIRFVSGGPGSGKSSLANILLSTLARRREIFPILIRLLQFRWDGSGFEAALCRYIDRYCNYLPQQPWSDEAKPFFANKTVVLVLDGLDELSKALGPRGESAAKALTSAINEFVNEKTRFVGESPITFKALILGRTASIQEIKVGRLERFDQREYILLSLDKEPHNHLSLPPKIEIIDEGRLLGRDDRETWWRQYKKASMREANVQSKMPSVYLNPTLIDLTREPLTLFFLAFSGYHDRAPLLGGGNLAAIYRDIFRGVYERDLKREAHAGQVQMSFSHFFRALQVIGFAASFSTERSATREDLRKTISDIIPIDEKIFSQFEEGVNEGAMKMLLAAHVRVREQEGEKKEAAYEFSHKTFGEFLAAECMWRLLRRAEASFQDRTISKSDTLIRMTQLLGRTELTNDFMRFFRGVVELVPSEVLDNKEGSESAIANHNQYCLCFEQEFLRPIIGACNDEGPPVHRALPAIPTFRLAEEIGEQVVTSLHQVRDAVLGALELETRLCYRAQLRELVGRNHAQINLAQRLRCFEMDGGVDREWFHRWHYPVIEGKLINVPGLVFRDCLVKDVEVISSGSRRFHANRTSFRDCLFEGSTFDDSGSEAWGALSRFFGSGCFGVLFEGCRFVSVQFKSMSFEMVGFLNCNFEDVLFDDCVFVEGLVHLSGIGWRIENCKIVKPKRPQRKTITKKALLNESIITSVRSELRRGNLFDFE